MGLAPLNTPAQVTRRRSGPVLRAQTPPSPGSPSRDNVRTFGNSKVRTHDVVEGALPQSPTSVLQQNAVVEDVAIVEGSATQQGACTSAKFPDGSVESTTGEARGSRALQRAPRKLALGVISGLVMVTVGVFWNNPHKRAHGGSH